MSVVVQKYGGSLMSDVDRIRCVAQRIVETHNEGKHVCVVVSAMGSSTDDLLALSEQISSTPPQRELDMLLSCGERISMALLSMAVIELGCNAISFTGSQSGIMTNDRHSNARIIEVRPIRIYDELERGNVVIVAGFQGVSYKREITTLGRGGSDTTAIALAAALDAEYCEILSDVEGVYTGDPTIIEQAKPIDSISYDAMKIFSMFGARVVHAEAVDYARRKNIVVHVGGVGKDSLVTTIGVAKKTAMIGVTTLTDVIAITMSGTDAYAQCSQICSQLGLMVRLMQWRDNVLHAIIETGDTSAWTSVRKKLLEGLGNDVCIDEDIAAVSVVGDDVTVDLLEQAVVTAHAQKIELRDVCCSLGRITLYCHVNDHIRLSQRLHEHFIT